jgi:hypothetical protein
MAADLDKPCPHEHFAAQVDVQRLTDTDDGPVTAYIAEVTVTCEDCDEPFRWTGVPAGFSGAHPTCSIDEKTLNAPMRPSSADRDFGLGIPGYSINYRGGSDGR